MNASYVYNVYVAIIMPRFGVDCMFAYYAKILCSRNSSSGPIFTFLQLPANLPKIKYSTLVCDACQDFPLAKI